MTRTIQVIDLFSGCGGLSHGFVASERSRSVYRLLGAAETDKHANATYKRMIGVDPINIDVRSLMSSQALEAALATWKIRRNRPLVVVGGPPCQGFSSHRKKDERSDPRDSLVTAFAQVGVNAGADVIVMENVPEILHTRHWHHVDGFRRFVTKAGYGVRARVFNLAAFGVPQERFRLLIVAAKDPRLLALPTPQLSPDRFVTVRQAIGALPTLVAGQVDAADPMHITSNHRQSTVDLIRMIPLDGGSRRDLPPGYGAKCLQTVDGFRDVYGRLFWDRPAVAITARCRTPSCGRYVHPEQHRGLSVREAALLQGFPTNFIFDGPFDDKFKQIGNAVPPPFAQAIADSLNEAWNGRPVERDTSCDVDLTKPALKSFSSSIAALKRRTRVT